MNASDDALDEDALNDSSRDSTVSAQLMVGQPLEPSRNLRAPQQRQGTRKGRRRQKGSRNDLRERGACDGPRGLGVDRL